MRQIFLLLDVGLKYLRRLALFVSAAGLIVMAALDTFDVLSSFLFDAPIRGISETIQVIMAASVALAIVSVQHRREHVCVDLLVNKLSPRALRVANFFNYVFSILCVGLISWQSWIMAAHSVRVEEVSATVGWFLVYPWKIFFALGFTIVLIEILRQAISSMLHGLDRNFERSSSNLKENMHIEVNP